MYNSACVVLNRLIWCG